ncbi:MAG TPA: hypothetical protein VFR18_13475 [Terriglobia bacterium]|nr:hypothetical protein [Terriglobia bacterium]
MVRFLRQCLERDRSKRMWDIGGAIFALDEALHEEPSVAGALQHAADPQPQVGAP